MNRQPRPAVVVITDGDLFYSARKLLRELIRHLGSEADIFCLHDGLSAAQLAELTRLGDVSLRAIPKVYAGFSDARVRPQPQKAHLFFSRFECWTESFSDHDPVVYIDVDTIVRGPLTELLKSDWYAAPERPGASVFIEGAGQDLHALLDADGFPRQPQDRANAGVLALGRNRRRAADFDQLMRLTRRYGPYLQSADQSVINLWMHQNGLEASTDRRFNFLVRDAINARRGFATLREARVLHFNGFSPAPRRLAIDNARFWLAVPAVGTALFYLTHRSLFDGTSFRRLPRLLSQCGKRVRFAASGWATRFRERTPQASRTR